VPQQSLLLSPIELRGVRLRNRIVVAPMCQYSADNGLAGDWHFVHYGKLAVGGAGVVMTEAVAVEARGRISHGDLGLWSDAHVEPLGRITAFIRAQGAAAAIQIAHAGRKAGVQRPWHGGRPLGPVEAAAGEPPWTTVAPSALSVGPDWPTPSELTAQEIAELCEAWRLAARRASEAGFDILEIHGAHGYLIHEFLSPLTNRRTDAYGGDREGRMRFALEITETVRAEWPADKPLFFRVSAVDGDPEGWTLDDTVALAAALEDRGVDVVDCSSEGVTGSPVLASLDRPPGYQVPFAARVRSETGLKTMAVGLIVSARQAEAVLRRDEADLIALGRELLYNPQWPLHAALELEGEAGFEAWPRQYQWSLKRRAPWMAKYKDQIEG